LTTILLGKLATILGYSQVYHWHDNQLVSAYAFSLNAIKVV